MIKKIVSLKQAESHYLAPFDYQNKANDTIFSRLCLLIGEKGIERVSSAKVVVLGLGGVGSQCVESLARSGIGSFVLVDFDIVEKSNINRQAIAFLNTTGKPKINVMAHMIEDINPDAIIEAYQYFLSKENIVEFIGSINPKPTYIIDAMDTISTKLALAQYIDTLKNHGIKDIPKLISAMGVANKLDPTKFIFCDIYDTLNCPMCRIVRKQARKLGISQLQVLYVNEIPQQNSFKKCSCDNNLGTISYMPAIMGQLLASYVLQDVLQNG